MEEAATFHMPHNLRGLLVTLIIDGGQTPKLWTYYQEFLIEDLTFRLLLGTIVNRTESCE